MEKWRRTGIHKRLQAKMSSGHFTGWLRRLGQNQPNTTCRMCVTGCGVTSALEQYENIKLMKGITTGRTSIYACSSEEKKTMEYFSVTTKYQPRLSCVIWPCIKGTCGVLSGWDHSAWSGGQASMIASGIIQRGNSPVVKTWELVILK